MATRPDPEAIWNEWLDAARDGRATLAAELRAMYLALTPGRAVPQVPLMTYPGCAACNGTIAEITRLTDQLRAHQAGVQHLGAPERI